MTVSLPSGQRDDKSRINYEHAKDGRDRSRLRRHSPIDRVDTSSRCPSCCATTRLFHFSAESRPRSHTLAARHGKRCDYAVKDVRNRRFNLDGRLKSISNLLTSKVRSK